jgi:hypothetical protein
MDIEHLGKACERHTKTVISENKSAQRALLEKNDGPKSKSPVYQLRGRRRGAGSVACQEIGSARASRLVRPDEVVGRRAVAADN